jgi:hypothetical protein
MSRAVLILGPSTRARAADWLGRMKDGTRVEFKAPRRTLEQNAKMWALLTDVSRQVEHCGRKYDADAWKSLFLHAMGREIQFLPALDGKTFLPIGLSSSDLSKAEMSELIEFILAWGAEHDVSFSEAA